MPDKREREMIGALFVLGMEGRSLQKPWAEFFVRCRVGAAVLFQRNAGDAVQVWELTRCLRRAGLVVGIDHEGGRVNRLPQPVTPTPPFAGLGLARSPRLAASLGELHGAELGALGFQVNYAPVLDVAADPRNRVIGDRAASADPAVAGELGAAYLRGLLSRGVLPCAKHFPGHGAVREDSHVSLPRSDADAETLEALHLPPFRAAIRAGVPQVMAAHVVVPAWDPVRPATFSRVALTDRLRGDLGFQGVVVTDDLQMAAVSRDWDIADRVLLALEAGADQLMICHDLEVQEAAVAAVWKAVDGRVLRRERLEASWARIGRLRKEARRAVPAKNREELLAVLGCTAHRQVADSIPKV
ncbi:MAG: beta-N-acetylhexosaminidase [Deltaproteobacteria bacterium]|nr:beta-N-acetylhexosaminidase [Deltaproteobacteria bacterium]